MYSRTNIEVNVSCMWSHRIGQTETNEISMISDRSVEMIRTREIEECERKLPRGQKCGKIGDKNVMKSR